MVGTSERGVAGARTGLVAIIGRPNVGKSTLLNALVGEQVSITSRKPQTTRVRVLGVLTRGEPPATTQFIFIDTPGFQRRHRSMLMRRMNDSVTTALREADVIVLLIDAVGIRAEDQAVVDLLPAECGTWQLSQAWLATVSPFQAAPELACEPTVQPCLMWQVRHSPPFTLGNTRNLPN